MNMDPLISVIVPIYNVKKYIHKCVDSIINQTYRNLEIILVDDGSTDECSEICDDYTNADSRIVVIHKENGGQGSARNVALDICNGEYIGFVDGDDWIREDMYESMYRAVNKHHAQLAICGISYYNNIRYVNGGLPAPKVFNNFELMREYVSTQNINSVPFNKLYNKSLFSDIRFPEIRAREDAYIIHEVLGKADCAVHIGNCKYVQLIRNNSTERRRFTPHKLPLKDCEKALQSYIKNKYPYLYVYVAARYANSIVDLMSDIVTSYRYLRYKEIYDNLRKELVSEIEKLEKTFFVSKKESKRLNFICNHDYLFRIKNCFFGINRKLRSILRKTFSLFRCLKQKPLCGFVKKEVKNCDGRYFYIP
jgi:glycosyltransferase involved in cell wall biosynthesis